MLKTILCFSFILTFLFSRDGVAAIVGDEIILQSAVDEQVSAFLLNVDKARTVIVNKRSMNTGFAGIQNELFGYDQTIMVFGDAKDMLNTLLGDLKEL